MLGWGGSGWGGVGWAGVGRDWVVGGGGGIGWWGGVVEEVWWGGVGRGGISKRMIRDGKARAKARNDLSATCTTSCTIAQINKNESFKNDIASNESRGAR